MAITKRLVKGSALTHTELDSNFTDLDGRVTTLESTPGSDSQTLTLAGDDLTITGGNTVSLSTLSTEVVDDTSPQLGGNLDLNGNEITGSGGSAISEVLNVLTLVGGNNGINMRTTTGAGKIVIGDQAGSVVLGNSANSVEFVNDVDVDFTNTNVDFTNATVTGLSIGQGIDDLSDVDTSTTPPGVGQVLKWDGAQWEPANDSSGSGGITLTALSVTSASASASSSLVYNNTTGVFTYTPALNTWASITGKDDANGPNEVTIGRLAGSGGDSSVAVGQLAGETSQGDYSSAFGPLAGRTNQGNSSVAIGNQAGLSNQGDYAVGIGALAGVLTQGERGIAIGYESGRSSQGADSIAIGTKAGRGSQGNNSIVLNATGVTLENTTASSLVIKPIRNASGTHSMEYNPTTGEVTYDTLGGGGGGIDLTALSVTSTSASASPSLVYNNTTGVFTYTPPNLTELGSNLDLNSNDITGTGNINIIGSITSTAVGTPTITSSTDIILSANSGSGIVNASGSKITNLGTPVAGTDAATKAYVDANGGGSLSWATLADKNNASGPTKIALGLNAGSVTQGLNTIAIGETAGETNQGVSAVAIGTGAATTNQGGAAIAIGNGTAVTNQGASAVAIGNVAALAGQGDNAIAIGNRAGGFVNPQAATSIILNATGAQLENTTADSFVVKPVRNASGTHSMEYNPTTGEITYDTLASSGITLTALSVTQASAGTAGLVYNNVTGVFTYTPPDLSTYLTSVPAQTFASLTDVNNANGPTTITIGKNAGTTNQGASSIALGGQAGETNQGAQSIAIGDQAGETTQGGYAVAIGRNAGETTQGSGGIAVGSGAGSTTQGLSGIAIGYLAGESNQGGGAIAIGANAGTLNQAADSIILNASNTALQNTQTGSLVIKPIRNASGTHSMEYNPSTGEVTYDTLASGGLPSRSPPIGATSSLADAAQADLDITGFKSYTLMAITTDKAARVRLYVNAATRTADAARAEGIDPTSDAGVIAEVITTGAETVIISPGAIGFNLESSPTTNIPCRVTNKSGSTGTVQVGLTILQLEA